MAERATIEIDAEVLESARRAAERRHVALEEFVEETIRAATADGVARDEGNMPARGMDAVPVYHPKVPGLLPGVPPIHHTAELLDYLDEVDSEAKRTA